LNWILFSRNNGSNKVLSNSKIIANNSKKISNSSINKKIYKNIKEKEYIESIISNSIISGISNPKSQKKYSENQNHISLHINIKNENKLLTN